MHIHSHQSKNIGSSSVRTLIRPPSTAIMPSSPKHGSTLRDRDDHGHDHATVGPNPLDEAWVEAPHILLELTHLEDHSPSLSAAAHLSVAGLAAVRATQCFRQVGWEAKLEATSAVALAAAGIATALPGGLAHELGHGAYGIHGLIELGLGVHDTIDAVQHDRGWKAVVGGSLGALKGIATVAPLVLPQLHTAGHIVELGALLGRISLGVKH